MPKPVSKRRADRPLGKLPHDPAQPSGTPLHPAQRLTTIAFALSILLVMVRALMSEAIRNPILSAFGPDYVPRSPGPATGLVLDLLFCLPAMLVIARRAIDREYSLRLSRSILPAALLAGWIAASTLWATDHFAARVAAAHWCAAIIFLWSTLQLVRSWSRLRLVAATAVGVLMVMAVQGLIYRYVELPDFQREWTKSQSELLGQMGKTPGSRDAEQFSKNIASGAPMGFTSSANTFAAMLVLTMIVAAGVAVQRVIHRDGLGWIVPLAIAAALGSLLIFYTQSKAAALSVVLAAVAFAAIGLMRRKLQRHAKTAYAIGVALFVVIAAAVVGHGLRHQTLPTDSLAFRWKYWVGAATLFRHHPLIGVGWDNFGSHYLAWRVPSAPEEIKDPHNFLVRAFVELGVFGGAPCAIWMLWLWWELTRPVIVTATDASDPRTIVHPRATARTRGNAVAYLAGHAAAAMMFNIVISLDWGAPGSFLVIEIVKRLVFLMALVAGLCVVALQSLARQEVDDRPAPWLLYGVLIGAGVFLVQNLVDFSMFEPGATFLLMLLLGAALGLRTGAMRRRFTTPVVSLILGISVLAWMAVGGLLVAPVAMAEGFAHDADEALRRAYSHTREAGMARSAGAREAASAATSLEDAFRAVPSNAEYALRAAQAWRIVGLTEGAAERARRMFDAAVAADPSSATYLLARADFQLESASASIDSIASDFENALRLDPNNVAARLRYADALASHGLPTRAAAEYEKALWYDAQLSREENKRLSDASRADVQSRLARLRAIK